MPFIIPLTYYFLLPHSSAFLFPVTPATYEAPGSLSSVPYTPIASAEDEDGEEEGTLAPGPNKGVHLTMADKVRLVKPLLLKYMLPLCESFTFLPCVGWDADFVFFSLCVSCKSAQSQEIALVH